MPHLRRALAAPLIAVLIASPVASPIASPIAAQAVRPLSFAISAGGTFVGGAERDLWRDGFAAQGTAAVGFPVLPVQLRADAGYQVFQARRVRLTDVNGNPVAAAVGDRSIWSATLSVVARPAATAALGRVRPYVTAGGGAYRSAYDVPVLNGPGERSISTNGGLTAGLGASLPVRGFNAFFEGRLHNVFGAERSTRSFPVVAGFLF